MLPNILRNPGQPCLPDVGLTGAEAAVRLAGHEGLNCLAGNKGQIVGFPVTWHSLIKPGRQCSFETSRRVPVHFLVPTMLAMHVATSGVPTCPVEVTAWLFTRTRTAPRLVKKPCPPRALSSTCFCPLSPFSASQLTLKNVRQRTIEVRCLDDAEGSKEKEKGRLTPIMGARWVVTWALTALLQLAFFATASPAPPRSTTSGLLRSCKCYSGTGNWTGRHHPLPPPSGPPTPSNLNNSAPTSGNEQSYSVSSHGLSVIIAWMAVTSIVVTLVVCSGLLCAYRAYLSRVTRR